MAEFTVIIRNVSAVSDAGDFTAPRLVYMLSYSSLDSLQISANVETQSCFLCVSCMNYFLKLLLLQNEQQNAGLGVFVQVGQEHL